MRLARKPQWISFDMYGTLIDTKVGYAEIWRQLLAEKGQNPDAKLVNECVAAWGKEEFRLIQGPYRKYREILKESVENTLRAAGLPVSAGDGERLSDAWGTFQPYADVKTELARLKENYKLAIITNSDNDIAEQSVANIGIEFDAVFTAEQSGAYKPSRIPFEYALKGMGVAPQDVLHVAFGYQYDHATASTMGFMTVWVNRRNLEIPAGARKFDIEIPNLSGLQAILGQ